MLQSCGFPEEKKHHYQRDLMCGMDLPTSRVLHMREGEQVNAADALCIALTRLTAQT